MTLSLFSYVSAIGPGLPASFVANGGTAPYIYSVVPGGAGGSINSSTGIYASPAVVPASVNQAYDIIMVTDALSNTATQKMLVGSPLKLFCNILQNQLGLADDHIYLWNQKLTEPKDYSLYIAVSVLMSKIFGNSNYFDPNTQQSIQSVNIMDTLQIDAISRGPSARDNRADIIMALKSNYAESQQELNSFRIGTLPANSRFINLSQIDGAAIPYRFQISVNMQYFQKKIQNVPYFSSFQKPQSLVNQ